MAWSLWDQSCERLILGCVGYFFCGYNKTHDQSDLWKKFILAYSAGESIIVGKARKLTAETGSWGTTHKHKQREQTAKGMRLWTLNAHPRDMFPPGRVTHPKGSTVFPNSATKQRPSAQTPELMRDVPRSNLHNSSCWGIGGKNQQIH